MYTNNKNTMAIITQYPLVTPAKGDYIVGSQLSTTGKQVNPTKNFTVANVVKIGLNTIPAYDDNAAAIAGGLAAGDLFQTTGAGANPLNVAGIVMIVQ
jgi:hypothetical protein|tara:strand:- start:991 stop:1284 length:294 start_codon:yes stop_codon:yes gene_type:complete